jgi:hypothetical protein
MENYSAEQARRDTDSFNDETYIATMKKEILEGIKESANLGYSEFVYEPSRRLTKKQMRLIINKLKELNYSAGFFVKEEGIFINELIISWQGKNEQFTR